MAGVNPGDEVIILDPFYPQHNSKVQLAGGKIVAVPLDKENGFHLDMDALKAAVSPKSCLLILINPSNPTGVVYSPEELTVLAEFCQKHDLIVLSDEVYEFITYEGASHISIASLPGMFERTITVSGFTKAYSMDGWRMGFAVAPQAMIRDLQKITMNDSTHPCVFAQSGAVAAVTGFQDCLEQQVAEDKRRRNHCVQRLNSMRGVSCHMPQASIYAFPDISALGVPASDLALRILESTHVAVEAGSFYGQQGANHLRICFGAQSYEKLSEALDRIENFLSSGAFK